MPVTVLLTARDDGSVDMCYTVDDTASDFDVRAAAVIQEAVLLVNGNSTITVRLTCP